MIHYAQLFANYLDTKDVKYTTQDERIIKVITNADNMDQISISIYFEKEGKPLVQLKCWEIMDFSDRREAGLALCGQLNETYRFVKFYLNDESNLICDADVHITDETAGEFCFDMMLKMYNIIDTAYETIARTRWA